MFAQTRSPFIKKLILLIILVFVWVRNSWCGFPQIHISISYLGNRLLQVIQSLLCVIVWLVEAINNLYPWIVLNPIFLCYAFLWSWSFISFAIYHRKLIPIYSLSLTIDNLVCGSIYRSSSHWIDFYCLIFFPRNLCGSRCLPCLFENVFDSYQVYLDGRQTFSSWYFVPLWKVYRVWFICLNLALFGSALSHSFLHVLFAWMR